LKRLLQRSAIPIPKYRKLLSKTLYTIKEILQIVAIKLKTKSKDLRL